MIRFIVTISRVVGVVPFRLLRSVPLRICAVSALQPKGCSSSAVGSLPE